MQKTDLNVAPYYDDFDPNDNFHRVLFRPGFAVQARELTTLQSILQNQIERHGRHFFKEGSMVIPGQISFDTRYYAVKLQGTGVNLSQYVNSIVTGGTSGITARVIGFTDATTTDEPTLYVKYISTATASETISGNSSVVGVTSRFLDGETLTSDNVATLPLTLITSGATETGSSAAIEEGIFFIRGQFVKVNAQRIVLDKYGFSPSYRVGLSITESLVTPETDTTLLDNATGTSNENAKGAHRLGFTLTLAKLPLGSTDDENFVELLRLENGVVEKIIDRTDYNIFQENIARRTFDESGNYTVRDYNVEVKDALDDGSNEGVYSSTQTTDDGNTPSESLLTVQVSPGKAYVRGYEIEQVAPSFIDVEKPRTTENFESAITNMEVGNFVRVNNVFGLPDISPFIDSELTEPYRTIDLHGDVNATRGSAPASGHVGVARARAFEHSSGNDSASTNLLANNSASGKSSQFNLYLFDIRMFTVLTVSAAPAGAVTQGAKITGAISGATGFIHSASSTTINLISVSGNFNTGENLISSAQTTSNNANQYLLNSGTPITTSTISTKNFDDVKSVFMNSSAAGAKFTADLVLDSRLALAGTVTGGIGGTTTTITGFNTTFQLDLKVGDAVEIDGAGSAGGLYEGTVSDITSNTEMIVTGAIQTAVSGAGVVRKRNQLRDQQKNLLLRKLRKDTIKTLKTDSNNGVSQTTQTIRRAFVTTTNNSGVISLTANNNETFAAESNTDYIVEIITAGSGGSGAAGDILNVTATSTTTFDPTGNALTITNNTVLGNGAKVKVLTTLTRTVAGEKIKTKKPTHLTLVDADSTSGAEYGTASQHKEISIGHADAYRLHAVLDSEDASTNPVLPQFTVTGVSGTFERGEVITQAESGCNALIINTTDPITFIVTNGKSFIANKTITGTTSGATATLGTFTAGSKDITNRFTLDTGQRDNFYDISRIVRKPGKPVPVGRLLIVCDYFEHGTGDFFSVDSYNAIDYKEIPTYTATRVDPEVRIPSGEFDLRDAVDFRPRVADATFNTSASIQGIQDVEKVTSMSFDFSSRSFAGTGASSILIPKDNSQFQYDFDFFLGRRDMLFLSERGNFVLKKGDPAEVPTLPKNLERAMLIATFNLPPYVLDFNDVTFQKTDNRRYTMRDIGSLERRINQVEYYATLNLLEKDAQSFQVQDENGLDRFKSGFVVDNFSGHGVGDVQNEDYRNSIDYEENELRPQFFMKGIELLEENTTDVQRTADGYQKTGKMITLPYTDVVGIQQPYATRVENLNPVLTFTWTGVCTLDPSGDEWFEVNRLPALVINVEGDFDQVAAENANILGTVWNSWQTQWSGTSQARNVTQRGNRVITRVTTTTTRRQRRTGINTGIVAQIDRESQGDKIRSTAMIPFMREKNVNFVADGLKPNTRIYPFFDKVNVTAHVTPTSASGITDHQNGTKGGNMFSDGGGHLEGLFQIPNPNVVGNPKFQTGDRLFRLTSSATNATVPEPETFAQVIFNSTGILRTVQEEIVATRNGRIEVTSVNDTRTLRNSTTRTTVDIRQEDSNDDNSGAGAGSDPLAQTFLSGKEGGEFVTKIDVFFQRKDPNITVLCQIREVVNGHPTLKVLPNAMKVLHPYLEGTVSITANQKIVTGVNTKFITGFGNLRVGDTVTINSAGSSISGVSTDTGNYDTSALVTKITAINSDTELVVADAATSTQSGVNISNVNISDTADVPTTFRFDEPVYLKEEEEFSMVLFTPCERYYAWISRMGELDRGGSRMVSKQPHLGVLFKSQNNTTWTPSDYEDLKFTLYRASFDTSKTGSLTLVNDVVPTQTLGVDPIRTINGQSLVQVEHPNHHMYSSTNNVTISGVSSGITTTLASAINFTDAASSGSDASKDFDFTANADFVASNDGSNIYVKIGNEIIRGTIPSSNKIRPLARGVGNTTATTHDNGATIELYQLNGIPLDQINKTHAGTLSNIGIDTYTVSTTTPATSSSNQGGSAVVATENAQMDGLQTLVPTIVYPDTTLNTNIRTTTGTSPSGTETPFSLAGTSFAKPMTLDENFFFQKPKIIASQINETNELSGQKSFYLNFDLRSTKENLSPVVDLDKKSVVAFTNRLNRITQASDLGAAVLQGDYVNSEAASGDSNEAIYITRRVALDTPATGIKLFLDINRFASADVKVMFKILRSDDASDFDEIGYNFFNTTGAPDTIVNPSLDVDDFKEYEYTANNLDEFIAFSIKIVMQGTNSSEPPRIKDLRAIALAT